MSFLIRRAALKLGKNRLSAAQKAALKKAIIASAKKRSKKAAKKVAKFSAKSAKVAQRAAAIKARAKSMDTQIFSYSSKYRLSKSNAQALATKALAGTDDLRAGRKGVAKLILGKRSKRDVANRLKEIKGLETAARRAQALTVANASVYNRALAAQSNALAQAGGLTRQAQDLANVANKYGIKSAKFETLVKRYGG